MCEWKGAATYHNLTLNSTSDTVKGKVWSYATPTPRFKGIQDYLCFYASGVPWTCYVDGEKVQPQEGDFYGGWVRIILSSESPSNVMSVSISAIPIKS